MRGSLNLSGNQTWLVPVWLQLLCSSIIATFILFMPESPRWLFVNGKGLSAIEIVTKYHGMGNPGSDWVTLQEQDFRELLNQDGAVAIPPSRKQCNKLLTLAGQTLVGLPRPLPQSSLNLPPRLQSRGKRLRPMDWPSRPRTPVERRSRHSRHTQCNRSDKSELGLFLPSVRHGHLRCIPRGPHRSSKSHLVCQCHPRSSVVWHGHSNLYTLPKRVCRLSKSDRSSDIHV